MKVITIFLLITMFALATSAMSHNYIGAGIGAGLLGIAVAISDKEN